MSNCYHCGSKIAEGAELLGLDNQLFCCSGCLAVAELIKSSDLQLYYQIRENQQGERVKKIPTELYLAYDVEEVANQYVYKNSCGNCEIQLFIDGIHCAACSWLISSFLKEKLALENVVVNATTARAEIIYPPEIKLSDILKTIAKLGYKPNLFTPSQDEIRQNKIRNNYLLRLVVSGLGMMQIMMFATGLYTGSFLGIERDYSQLLRWVSLILTTPIFLYAGFPFLNSAFWALKNKKINIDVPIASAIFFAFIASVINTFLERGEIYFDSVVMFIFFITISRFLEFLSRRRAKLNSLSFSKLLPEALEVWNERDKKLKFCPLPAIQKGEIVKILPTQTIAFDGIIYEGQTRVSEAMLTGEGKSLSKKIGDKVLAGSLNLESPILIKVETTGQETTLAGIERLIAKAQKPSPNLEKSQKLAQQSIISILVLAFLAWLIWLFIDKGKAFDIALAVLVATCPCALSLAIPTVLTSAINKANSLGIFIKSSESLEKLLKIKNIIFDKTGTLTEGNFRLIKTEFFNPKFNQKLILQIAKTLEKNSSHPLGWAVVKSFDLEELKMEKIKLFREGVLGVYQGEKFAIGSLNFIFETFNLKAKTSSNALENEVFLARENEVLAKFYFSDPIVKDLKNLIAKLKAYKLIIASGDNLKNVEKIAQLAEISEFYGNLKPEEKIKILESQKTASLVVGDGINDAPLMKKADLSIAVKGANPMSQGQADIVLISKGIESLPYLFALAKKCQKIIKQNLIWAVFYNLLILPLAIFGFLTPWIAALGMSLSSLLVVLNALRILKFNFVEIKN